MTIEIECERGDWIPGANFVCQHREGILQGLGLILVVSAAVATGGMAAVAIGGSSGIAIGGGGGALALAGGSGAAVGGGAIVISPAMAGSLSGTIAGLGYLMSKNWSTNPDDYEDYDYSDEPMRGSRDDGGQSNIEQNRLTDRIAAEAGLDAEQADALHRAISGRHFTEAEIRQIADDIVSGAQY